MNITSLDKSLGFSQTEPPMLLQRPHQDLRSCVRRVAAADARSLLDSRAKRRQEWLDRRDQRVSPVSPFRCTGTKAISPRMLKRRYLRRGREAGSAGMMSTIRAWDRSGARARPL